MNKSLHITFRWPSKSGASSSYCLACQLSHDLLTNPSKAAHALQRVASIAPPATFKVTRVCALCHPLFLFPFLSLYSTHPLRSVCPPTTTTPTMITTTLIPWIWTMMIWVASTKVNTIIHQARAINYSSPFTRLCIRGRLGYGGS